MKTKLVAVMTLIFCVFMAEASKAEGNGDMITREVPINSYSKIELGGSTEYSGNNSQGDRSSRKFPVFKYTYGRSASLKITISENLPPFLSIKSNNERLAIRIRDGTRIKPTQYVTEGSSKTLRYLKTSGPIDFEVQNVFPEDQLEIKTSSSSDIKSPHNVKLRLGKFSVSGSGDLAFTDLDCKNFTSRASSSGDIILKGKADEVCYPVPGNGDIRTYDLSVNDLSCLVSGSGDARVYTKDNINLSVSGSGDIRYKGPANMDKSESGSGSIQGAN